MNIFLLFISISEYHLLHFVPAGAKHITVVPRSPHIVGITQMCLNLRSILIPPPGTPMVAFKADVSSPVQGATIDRSNDAPSLPYKEPGQFPPAFVTQEDRHTSLQNLELFIIQWSILRIKSIKCKKCIYKNHRSA